MLYKHILEMTFKSLNITFSLFCPLNKKLGSPDCNCVSQNSNKGSVLFLFLIPIRSAAVCGKGFVTHSRHLMDEQRISLSVSKVTQHMTMSSKFSVVSLILLKKVRSLCLSPILMRFLQRNNQLTERTRRDTHIYIRVTHWRATH